MSDPTPTAPTEEKEKKQIVCVTCGKSFDFDQTYEGRCFRDHVAYSDRERDKLDALRRNSSSGGGNVTVTGPTIAMSNQQTAQQQQTVSYAPAPYIVAAPKRRRCWARYSCRSKLIFLVCLFGIAFAITYVILLRGKFKGHDKPQHHNATTTFVHTPMPTL